jgi:Ran GTPase-activating protein (RanGAP) involved in mRNA processing and transport
LSPTSITYLMNALKKNTTLRELDISYNQKISMACANSIANMLSVNTTLDTLNLCSMEYKHARVILRELVRNRSIRKIKFNDVKFNEQVTELTNMLDNNTTLHTLKFDNCTFNDRGMFLLTSSLARNTTLKKFSIKQNKISRNSATHIADYLRSNPALKKLSLNRCNITNEMILQFADALQTNNTLNHLDLRDIPLTNEVIDRFYNFLQGNTSLGIVNIESKDFERTPTERFNAVNQMLARNRCIIGMFEDDDANQMKYTIG